MTDTLKSAQAAIAKYDEVQGKSLYQDEVAAFCDAANASIAAIREMSAEAVAALDASAPERIWLQVDTDGDNDDRSEPIPRESWDELTWHYEPIGGQEVEYVRVDLAHPAPKLPVEVREAMKLLEEEGAFVWKRHKAAGQTIVAYVQENDK